MSFAKIKWEGGGGGILENFSTMITIFFLPHRHKRILIKAHILKMFIAALTARDRDFISLRFLFGISTIASIYRARNKKY